eukprot:TRINITY_DN2387_c0_g1_i3.p3 TRINITY_DN2387_c0_g1~~TRINITY_DN2387_c0_g1_i3.p3  ORF type:complete len:107 (-),score=0.50 TRINITY_DN2387_c0_g1_i3:607-927(-)
MGSPQIPPDLQPVPARARAYACVCVRATDKKYLRKVARSEECACSRTRRVNRRRVGGVCVLAGLFVVCARLAGRTGNTCTCDVLAPGCPPHIFFFVFCFFFFFLAG